MSKNSSEETECEQRGQLAEVVFDFRGSYRIGLVPELGFTVSAGIDLRE